MRVLDELEPKEATNLVTSSKCIKWDLAEFPSVMPKELPEDLPPKRRADHVIKVISGVAPLAKAPYRMNHEELKKLKVQLEELLTKGYIKSPYGALVFFIHKKDGTLKMCVDYRAPNKVMVKNWYPLPRIDDLFDRLSGIRVFSRINLHLGYYQIWIAKEMKKRFVIAQGMAHMSSWWCLLGSPMHPPHSTISWMTFSKNGLMISSLFTYMTFLIYNGSLEEHVEHLWKVFQRLRENKLYAKFKKCEFGVTKVDFLGHMIT